MSGTKTGARKAVLTNKERYGRDFYAKIGAKGQETWNKLNKEGKAKPRGFSAMTPEQRSEAGRKGGSAGRKIDFIETEQEAEWAK